VSFRFPNVPENDELGPRERETLALVADVLIPPHGEMPSASAAGVATDGIDHVLASRPDLRKPIFEILDAVQRQEPRSAIAQLEQTDPMGFDALLVAVAGAYYMNAGVRRLIGYPGQEARPLEDSFDVAEDLLEPLFRRGPIYRRTEAER
jgi:hypothetical protein